MAKFNTPQARANATSPILTLGGEAVTYEGGQGFDRSAKSELFLLGVSNFVKEDTFYEKASDRDDRFQRLIHKVVQDDPDWVRRFAAFLRGPEANMRSASIVLGAEYARAGGPNPRQVVASVLQRADEPGEFLSYWFTNYGRKIPAGVKRGVADAVIRLFSEYAALKYDGQSKGMRLGDVIELVHPKPKAPWQAALFAYLLDRRHHASEIRANLSALEKVGLARDLDRMDETEFRKMLLEDPSRLADAGYTWERLGGKTKLDAKAWEAVIPTMGYMALLRNLRNFDEAGVSNAVKDAVAAKLSDPEEVAKSRQFPFRFWSAQKATAGSAEWLKALERALDASTSNIPALDGTLVLIDTSASMTNGGYGYSGSRGRRDGQVEQNRPLDVAALAALAVKRRSANTDVVIFGDGWAHVPEIKETTAVLRGMAIINDKVGSVGHSTNGHSALAATFNVKRHKRAMIFTDGQMHDSGRFDFSHVPIIYNFNVAGYSKSHMPEGDKGRYALGGFTDATFKMVPLLEAGKSAEWPF